MATKRTVQKVVGLPTQNLHISEFASDCQGAPSPFGDELPLPLPVDVIRYAHPGPEERPHLAEDTTAEH